MNSMKVDIYNLKNEKAGTAELSDAVFGAPWRPALVKQVLLAQQASRRSPLAHAKDRSEVSGGGKKPWRQKGTGRARHGSTRSPIWRKGGATHGPRKERDYSQKVNKKMRRAAIASVLSRKFKEGEVRVFDTLVPSAPKTKEASNALKNVMSLSKRAKKFDVLLVPGGEAYPGAVRVFRNLVKTKVLPPSMLNVEDLLAYKHIFFDTETADAIGRATKS